jgi:Hypervirulence associated proteins TUDOR domain
MSDAPKVGDHVQWNTSQGKTRGTVKRRLTSPTRIKGHEVKASEDNPEYLVESATSGKGAAHRPDALREVS